MNILHEHIQGRNFSSCGVTTIGFKVKTMSSKSNLYEKV